MNPIEQALTQVKGVTFATVHYTTEVKTAAIYKHRRVQESSIANVMLTGSVKDTTHVFQRAVKKSAKKFNCNSQSAIDNFTPSNIWYKHTPSYSIVQHKRTGKKYLYALYNTKNQTKRQYYIDGQPASKQDVANLLTPSAAKELLNPKTSVINKTHGIEHDVTVRVISLDNVTQLKVKKSIVIN